mmetsp:Transcript_41058/g.98295  ORF Transcript_41058/g.98295 Transcript_41058/m.98295 type:complete len:551 (-) Transcript_41058:170-1822(-)
MSSSNPFSSMFPTMMVGGGRKRKTAPVNDDVENVSSMHFAKSRKMPPLPPNRSSKSSGNNNSSDSTVATFNSTSTTSSSTFSSSNDVFNENYLLPDPFLVSSSSTTGATGTSKEDRRLSFGCLPRMTAVSATVPTTPLISGTGPRTPLVPAAGNRGNSGNTVNHGGITNTAVGVSTLMKSKMLQTPASSAKTPMLSGFNRYSWSVGKSIMKAFPSGLGGFSGMTPNDENFLNSLPYHNIDDEIESIVGGNKTGSTNMKKQPPVSPTPGQKQKQQQHQQQQQPKHKSIAVLATTFMNIYEGSPIGEKIIVDKTVDLLGTERRRIYDLFNVLDSIRLVRKVERQTYEWLGTAHLSYVLGELQAGAVGEYPVEANRFLGYHDDQSRGYDHWDFGMAGQNGNNNAKPPVTGKYFPNNQNAKKVGKDRSMSKLSHDFLKVFLVGHDTLSLQQASDLMQGTTSPLSTRFDQATENSVLDSETRKLNMRQQKAKIRRLYDLANIFVSVGLLQKVEAAKIPGQKANRRPDYTWTYRYSAQQLRDLYKQQQHQEAQGAK